MATMPNGMTTGSGDVQEYPDADEDICGLCGLPGADKIPHPIHWPQERVPDTDLVHAECEQEACAEGAAKCQGREREQFLASIR